MINQTNTFWEAVLLFHVLWTPSVLSLPPLEEIRFLHFPVISQWSLLTFLNAAAEWDTMHNFNQSFNYKSNICILTGIIYSPPWLLLGARALKRCGQGNNKVTFCTALLALFLDIWRVIRVDRVKLWYTGF